MIPRGFPCFITSTRWRKHYFNDKQVFGVCMTCFDWGTLQLRCVPCGYMWRRLQCVYLSIESQPLSHKNWLSVWNTKLKLYVLLCKSSVGCYSYLLIGVFDGSNMLDLFASSVHAIEIQTYVCIKVWCPKGSSLWLKNKPLGIDMHIIV